MKRHNNLFDQIASIDNLYLAHERAQKGKGRYESVKEVNNDVDGYLLKLHKLLISGNFTTSPYILEDLEDNGKLRVIYKLPYYPDRIVQHAIMNVCKDFWYRSLIRDTFQSIDGRGCHDAKRRIELYLSKATYHYAIKLDVKKYYPSISNVKMKLVVRRTIKCKRTLALLDDIIDSCKGLPIGNYLSQYFGNLFLSQLDWWVKQELGLKGYFRYCDDIVLIDTNLQYLRIVSVRIREYVASLGLAIKDDELICQLEGQGLDFCGFIFYGWRTDVRKRIKRALTTHPLSSVPSYWGWFKVTNSKKFWRNSKIVRQDHSHVY